MLLALSRMRTFPPETAGPPRTVFSLVVHRTAPVIPSIMDTSLGLSSLARVAATTTWRALTWPTAGVPMTSFPSFPGCVGVCPSCLVQSPAPVPASMATTNTLAETNTVSRSTEGPLMTKKFECGSCPLSHIISPVRA